MQNIVTQHITITSQSLPPVQALDPATSETEFRRRYAALMEQVRIEHEASLRMRARRVLPIAPMYVHEWDTERFPAVEVVTDGE